MIDFLLGLGSSLPAWLRALLAVVSVPAGFLIGNNLKPELGLRRLFLVTLILPIVLFVASPQSRHSLLVLALLLLSVGFWLGLLEARPVNFR